MTARYPSNDHMIPGLIPDMHLSPFFGEIPAAVSATKSDVSPVDLDLREQRGNLPLLDRVLFYLEEGIVLRIVASGGRLHPFTIGATPHLFVICDEVGFCGAFADLETALRFGLNGGYKP